MGYQLDFGALAEYLGFFLEGTAVTLGLTAVASVIGIGIGITGAAALRSNRPWLRKLVAAYVELIRNTPFIVQMFFIFFGLPSLGIRLSALTAAALAMTVNLAAYAIEIIRAGLEGVPKGQSEAAKSLGLWAMPVFGLVVLPQAIANVYPALIGQITITMLESAVVSQIAVVDLTHVADFIQSRNFRSFETYLVVTVIYLFLAIAMRRLLVFGGRGLFAGRVR
jgi:polar amino acid transport system permease protein